MTLTCLVVSYQDRRDDGVPLLGRPTAKAYARKPSSHGCASGGRLQEGSGNPTLEAPIG